MSSSHNNNGQISAGEIITRLQNKEALNMLDVREPIEFHTHNIGGINIPVSQLATSIQQIDWAENDEIIVICSKGIRSETAKSILEQNGYHNVRNLKGGLLAIEKQHSISNG
ncbi:rhodanese-like domain-containing protein [Mucilaginibacter sp. KACC 22063]|uniref:rhodanese-like domain-containing protein n=1 Tax=Mucilaginibacter sp. KACC 22063 TaxID=3025666 RepID=UPI002365DA68|nr:rhodanese-like domain-containing protein [Mucilaginibacter sp. KACC 22063]WDF57145.1 rhodanese-like domain-containing protein [Mucilaginibacter sp. KACC 22063]